MASRDVRSRGHLPSAEATGLFLVCFLVSFLLEFFAVVPPGTIIYFVFVQVADFFYAIALIYGQFIYYFCLVALTVFFFLKVRWLFVVFAGLLMGSLLAMFLRSGVGAAVWEAAVRSPLLTLLAIGAAFLGAIYYLGRRSGKKSNSRDGDNNEVGYG